MQIRLFRESVGPAPAGIGANERMIKTLFMLLRLIKSKGHWHSLGHTMEHSTIFSYYRINPQASWGHNERAETVKKKKIH